MLQGFSEAHVLLRVSVFVHVCLCMCVCVGALSCVYRPVWLLDYYKCSCVYI